MVSAEAVVVCAGGGGIPVVVESGRLRGAEAVIDKDLTAALLAEEVEAERLMMLTNVPYVERDWGSSGAAPIKTATPAELREALVRGRLDGQGRGRLPLRQAHRRRAIIGSLAELGAISRGEAGTRVAASRPQFRSSRTNSAAICR